MYNKYWKDKKDYQIWKNENDIWYLFYLSKKNNCFIERYYLLKILLVSKCFYTNQEAKNLIENWNLEYEKINKRDKKKMELLRGK